MQPIRITRATCQRIEELLDTTNGAATQHVFLVSLILRLVERAEHDVTQHLLKRQAPGARFGAVSGKPTARAYGFGRQATEVVLRRRAAGWYLAGLRRRTIKNCEGGETTLFSDAGAGPCRDGQFPVALQDPGQADCAGAPGPRCSGRAPVGALTLRASILPAEATAPFTRPPSWGLWSTAAGTMWSMTPRSRRRASSPPAAAPSAPALVRDGEGREVVKLTTPDGVTAWVAACIPVQALTGLRQKLHRQLTAIRKRQRGRGR